MEVVEEVEVEEAGAAGLCGEGGACRGEVAAEEVEVEVAEEEEVEEEAAAVDVEEGTPEGGSSSRGDKR